MESLLPPRMILSVPRQPCRVAIRDGPRPGRRWATDLSLPPSRFSGLGVNRLWGMALVRQEGHCSNS